MSLIERLTAILGLIGTILGGYIYLETNFASAADLKALQTTVEKKLDSQRRRALEDRIFELEFKQRQTPREFRPIDGALLERYKREVSRQRKPDSD